ncbi:MAG: D-alanyl-D-alanine carboxypeptidase/D-alanyl-D-alanine-endopeptidase [Vicinamibacterales bacterium]
MTIRSRVCAVALATSVLAGACAARTPAPPPQPPPAPALSPTEQLQTNLAGLFSAPALGHAHLAVLVRSLTNGETFYALNERRMMVPASNQKLLTAAAAAARLGWDYRYTTKVLANGTLLDNGTLEGDLIIVGGGDPTINPRHPARWAALDDWAGQIAARGVKVIGGNLIGDDNAFAEPGWGSGWSWEDLALGYGSPVGALQYHENQVELMIGPGLEPGARAIISTSPAGSGMLIDHGVTTVAEGGPTRIVIERVPGFTILTVRGQIAVGAKPRVEYAAVENPTLLFVNAFREALARKGVFVSGTAMDVDALVKPLDLSKAETWVTDQSAPLFEIVDVLQKWSRNGYAETLLWSLSPPGAPASEAEGLKALRDTLTALGVAPELYGAFDGSGLSRYDMVSAEALATLLTRIWNDPPFLGPYRNALPVAGVSGSLETRMKGTPAENRVWAKTGSMFNIRSLSGYVLTADDEPLVFSFLANNYTVPSREIDEMMDHALVRLASFTRR